MVGSHLSEILRARHEVVTVSRNSKDADLQLDLERRESLEKAISIAKPDAVINCVKAPMSVDEMEVQRESAHRANALLPKAVAHLQEEWGYRMVQISTDWVYEGLEGVVYTESSPIRPLNYYSETKAEAEESVRALGSSALIVRTEGVFGHDGRNANFLMRLKASSGQEKPFPAASDQFSQPISGPELARKLMALLEGGADGTYNLVGPDYISRLEFAEMACRVLGLECSLEPISAAGRKIPVPRHLRLSISRLEEAAGKVMPLEKQLEEFR